MSETIVTAPGVYDQEVDNSYIAPPANPGGLAVVGPTQKGAAYVPTDISSFSQYNAVFGLGTDTSYVPQTVYSYLQAGNNVKVTRVLGNGGWQFNTTNKIAAVVSGSTILSVFMPSHNATPSGVNLNSSSVSGSVGSFALNLVGTNVSTKVSASYTPSSNNYITKLLGTDETFATSSAFPYINFGNYASSASVLGTASLVLTTSNCTFTSSYAQGYAAASTPWVLSNAGVRLFKFVHTSHGFQTNTDVKVGITNITVNANSSIYTTFNVVVRAWNDTEKNPNILEQYINVSMDPTATNYIGSAIGDKYQDFDATTNKIVEHGDFPNQSNYIRIVLADGVVNGAMNPGVYPNGHEALYETIAGFSGYFLPSASLVVSNTGSTLYSGFDYYNTDNTFNYLNPVPSEATTGSNVPFTLPSNDNKFILPMQGGTDGISYAVIRQIGANISNTGNNVFGYDLSSASAPGAAAYIQALNILSVKDLYSFNVLAMPGVLASYHGSVVSYATSMVEGREDAVYVIDLADINSTVSNAISTVQGLNSTYTAAYYPWIKIVDVQTGKKKYMPPSVVVPQAIAYNDNVGNPWTAVSGTSRGVLGGAIDTKNRLTQAEIGLAYAANVNCIIKKPNTPVMIWGQQTTQIATTALSSLQVRRLLIELKNYINNVANSIVWENNTAAVRNTFVSQVDPYLEGVQNKGGVYAYQVVMDETNNTNSDIDRLVINGLIRVQPTKAIEYVLLTFNITPTGVSFS